MAYYEKRKDGWSVRWRDPDGTNRRRQVPDAASRTRLLREIEQAHAEGRRWEPVARRNPTIPELVEDYLREMKRVWRAHTFESHDVSLSIFEAWLTDAVRQKHLGVELLSKALLGRFWDHCREERHMRVSTANLRARSIEQFWVWCWEHEEFGAAVPRPRKLQLPARDMAAVRAPTWADMDASIAAHTTLHYQRLCFVMRCTGLRKSQAFGLRWEDVDFESASLVVRPELGKSAQERAGRIVPMAPVLVAEITGWGRREGWLVEWPSPLRKAHNITLERAWSRAGVETVKWKARTAHAYRKGFISGLVQLGAHREAVEHLVGHSMGLRGVYTDPLALPLRDAVALVPAMSTTRVLRLVGEPNP